MENDRVVSSEDCEALGRPCPTCGSEQTDQYCASCGEKLLLEEARLGALLRSALRETLQLDGRLLRTLRLLFTQPGQLTADHMAGRRRLYIGPLPLYLLTSLVFFLLVPHTGYFKYTLDQYVRFGRTSEFKQELVLQRLARTGESMESFNERFNERIASQKRAVMFLMVPGLALALGLLYRKRKKFFAQHLIFSTHFFSAYMLYMGFAVPVIFWLLLALMRPIALANPGLIPFVNFLLGEAGLTLALYGPATIYLKYALERVYAGRSWASWLRGAALAAWCLAMVVLLFKEPLFYASFYTL